MCTGGPTKFRPAVAELVMVVVQLEHTRNTRNTHNMQHTCNIHAAYMHHTLQHGRNGLRAAECGEHEATNDQPRRLTVEAVRAWQRRHEWTECGFCCHQTSTSHTDGDISRAFHQFEGHVPTPLITDRFSIRRRPAVAAVGILRKKRRRKIRARAERHVHSERLALP